jgi:outer membrane protein
MKKLMFTALAVVSFTFVQAQEGDVSGFAKGDIFISGAVGYNSTSTGDNKNGVFTITPRAGYFITGNIAVGARIGYVSRSIENGATELEIKALNVGGFGRYYFTPTNKFSVFGEFGIDYLSSNEDNGTTDTKSDGFGVGGGPGVSYFIGKSFALEAFWGALKYNTTKPDGGESTDSFNIGVDLEDITLGMVYKF